jgi:hypothetical protein
MARYRKPYVFNRTGRKPRYTPRRRSSGRRKNDHALRDGMHRAVIKGFRGTVKAMVYGGRAKRTGGKIAKAPFVIGRGLYRAIRGR